MRALAKPGALAAMVVLVVAVPAIAKPSHPAKSKKCAPHKVAYIGSGKLASWGAMKNSSGSWDGPITVVIKAENHHVKGQKGATAPFMLGHTKVRLGKGVPNPPVPGDRAVVLGKITEVAKGCTGGGTVSVREVDVSKK
jgi:hypothetical protein